jgi:hypothetical protein
MGQHPTNIFFRSRDIHLNGTINQALREGYDEVLVVSHSSGAHLGVSVLARLERAGILSTKSPISFLSLGHVVPMVSFLPAATELRTDLKNWGTVMQ